MLTIQIDDELEAALLNAAQSEHINPEQLVKKLIADYTRAEAEKPVLMTDLIQDLPLIDAFEGDPVEI